MEKETPVKRKSPPSKREKDQVPSLNQNQDGGDGARPSKESEDQNEIATILSNSIAKYKVVITNPKKAVGTLQKNEMVRCQREMMN